MYYSLSIVQIPLEHDEITLLELFEDLGSDLWHILVRILGRPETTQIMRLRLAQLRVQGYG